MISKIKLRIRSVHCHEETGLQSFWGNDEIYLGGIGIGNKRTVTRIEPYEISGDFDKGEDRIYDPPEAFVIFDVNITNKWPLVYRVIFVLIERDDGESMHPFIDNLSTTAEQKIEEKIAQNSEGALGPIVTIIASAVAEAAVAYAIEKAPELISQLGGDEIFFPRDVKLEIPSLDFSFSGSNISEERSIEFRAHDGFYTLFYDWELV